MYSPQPNAGIAVASKVLSIPEEQAALDKTLNDLQDTLLELKARLEVVCAPEMKAPMINDGSAPQPPVSPFANYLRTMRRCAEDSLLIAREMNARLEL